MYKIFIVFSALSFLYLPSAQALVINSVGVAVSEDFAGFDGSGFSSTPSAGQLDSDVWRVTGLSDGDGSFGGTYETGDFARGSASAGVTTGGIWSFDLPGSGRSLGVQPTGGDFTSGAITLRLFNNTAVTLTSLLVDYDLSVFNDQLRSSFFNFSYSYDDGLYTGVPTEDVDSPGLADHLPSWSLTNHTLSLSGLNVLAADSFYLRWFGDDNSSSGSRDQFSLDNISVTGLSSSPSVSVPEPGTWWLMVIGLAMLGFRKGISG